MKLQVRHLGILGVFGVWTSDRTITLPAGDKSQSSAE